MIEVSNAVLRIKFLDLKFERDVVESTLINQLNLIRKTASMVSVEIFIVAQRETRVSM